MAASGTLQSFLANPIARVQTRYNVGLVPPSSLSPRQWSNGRLRQVRCMAKDQERNNQTTPDTETQPPAETVPQAPKPQQKVSTRLSDVFAFSGPGPERINGRLAMVGFVAAMAAELARGDDLAAQLANGGVTLFVGTSVVLTLASLVPLLKGISVESLSKGLWTSDAEMWNGRFAMLGLVALFFTEYVKGGALV